MRKITVTTKTSAQIAAEFDTVFKNVQPPPGAKPATQADRLQPYRGAVMKQRRRGLTWEQIAAGMAQKPIEEKVSPLTLKRTFDAKAKPAPAPLPPGRLVLDPVTMKPTTPQA